MFQAQRFQSLKPALRDDIQRESESFFRMVRDIHTDTRDFFHQKIAGVTGSKEGEFLLSGGEPVTIGNPITDAELIGETLTLAPIQNIARKMDLVSRTASKVGADPFGRTGGARDLVDWVFSDVWRTTILVRAAYIVRNVAEMSVRMSLVGRRVFSDPLGFTATALATKERGKALSALERGIDKFNRGRNAEWTADGTSFRVPREAEEHLEGAIQKHADIVNSALSTGDHRMLARHSRRYDVKGAKMGDPKLSFAIAEQIGVVADSLVHQLVAGRGPKQAEKWIAAKMKSGGMERDEAVALWFRQSTEGRKWVETVLRPSAPSTADAYLDPVGVKNILFDAPNSVRQYQRLLTNNFQPELLALIQRGPMKLVNKQGKVLTQKDIIRGKQRGYDEKIASIQRMINVKSFGDDIKQGIDDMDGISYIVPDKKMYYDSEGTGIVKKGVNWFFQQSANMERQMAMGPEFRYAYWDEVSKFFPMLDEAAQTKIVEVAGGSLPKNHMIHKIIKDTKERGEFTLKDIEDIASNRAGKHVEELFYRAMDKKAGWHAMRLAIPFGQAWWNTMAKWTALTAENPTKAYLLTKALNAGLQDQVGGAIYTTPGLYSGGENWGREQGGFFFADEGLQDSKIFKYPTAFTNLGGLLSGAQNGAEYTGSMSSLNFAFGAESPLPGLGPALAMPVNTLVGSKPGETRDLIRQWANPFGVENNLEGVLSQFMPTYARSAFMGAALGEERSLRQHQLGAFMSVANDPGWSDKIGSPTYSAEVGAEAEKRARLAAFMRGLGAFFSIASPSERAMMETEDGEIVSTRRAVDEFQTWVKDGIPPEYAPVTFIADDYAKLESAYGRDEAIDAFGTKYGYNNIVALISSTSAESKSMTGPGWDYWSKNKDSAQNIGYEALPVLFPGDVSIPGNRYLASIGARSKMSWKEQADAAAQLVFDLQIRRQEQRAAEMGWTTDELAGIKEQVRAMNGGAPVQSFDPGRSEREVLGVRRAVQDPDFMALPHAREVAALMNLYDVTMAGYRQQTGDGRATLKGKGAAQFRADFIAQVNAIVSYSQQRSLQDGSGLTAQGVAEMLIREVETG